MREYVKDDTTSKFKFKEKPEMAFWCSEGQNLFSEGSTIFPVGANQPSRWVSDEGNLCSIINIFNNYPT